MYPFSPNPTPDSKLYKNSRGDHLAKRASSYSDNACLLPLIRVRFGNIKAPPVLMTYQLSGVNKYRAAGCDDVVQSGRRQLAQARTLGACFASIAIAKCRFTYHTLVQERKSKDLEELRRMYFMYMMTNGTMFQNPSTMWKKTSKQSDPEVNTLRRQFKRKTKDKSHGWAVILLGELKDALIHISWEL
ncbi:hypothetical protein J6590_040177 [Homalodisca vitripennis]|nr:hypothetical protein J6590_040177 [Homalodisca vitripennis]